MKMPWGERFTHLRARMILTYTLLIVVGFGGLAWLAGGQISRAAQEDFAAAHLAQTALLARSLTEDAEHYLHEPTADQALRDRLQDFWDQLQTPIVLFDADGRAVFDVDGPIARDKSTQTPEIMSAHTGIAAYAIRPNPAGEMTVFAAAPIFDEGKAIGVVQTARPLHAADATVRQRWSALAIGVSVLALLTVIASSWLATSLTRPLEALRGAALRLAAGDLTQRLPTNRADEIGQVATAFNHMAAEVQMMLEEQRAFAANAAHELRTPLTSIRLRSEALRNEALESALARQYIAEIDDEAARLGGLVEDLSLLARLDAGRDVRGSDQIEVARLVRSLQREFATYPEAQEVTFNLVSPSDLPPLTASLNHLRVLLRNLFSNALAYTPAGGSITCTLERVGDKGEDEELLITVTDTGQGIAADDLPHVTERFFRADKAHTRAVKGTGLGLTLVQSIVQRYRGRLEITSAGLGQGTSVRVWWPLHPTSSDLSSDLGHDNDSPVERPSLA